MIFRENAYRVVALGSLLTRNLCVCTKYRKYGSFIINCIKFTTDVVLLNNFTTSVLRSSFHEKGTYPIVNYCAEGAIGKRKVG